MSKTITNKDCEKWRKSPKINPKTGKKLYEKAGPYKKYLEKCGSPYSKSPKKTTTPDKDFLVEKKCEKWLQNKLINPRTNRAIKSTGKVYKDLQKKCEKSPSRSPKGKSPVKIHKKSISFIGPTNKKSDMSQIPLPIRSTSPVRPVSGRRNIILQEARELLEGPEPIGEHKVIHYYGKDIVVPFVGDIIMVEFSDFSLYYVIIISVENGPGKKGLKYRGVTLKQKDMPGGSYTPSQLSNRNMFEINPEYPQYSKIIDIFPKERNRILRMGLFHSSD